MHSNIRIIPSVDHFFIDRYGSRELWNMRLEISNLIDSLVANLISFLYNLLIHTEKGESSHQPANRARWSAKAYVT